MVIGVFKQNIVTTIQILKTFLHSEITFFDLNIINTCGTIKNILKHKLTTVKISIFTNSLYLKRITINLIQVEDVESVSCISILNYKETTFKSIASSCMMYQSFMEDTLQTLDYKSCLLLIIIIYYYNYYLL